MQTETFTGRSLRFSAFTRLYLRTDAIWGHIPVTSAARDLYKLATLMHKCVNDRAPEYLAEFCHPSVDRRPGMRSAVSGKLHVPCTQTSFGDRSFAVAGQRTWNNLPDAIRDSSLSFLTFTKLLKSYLFV